MKRVKVPVFLGMMTLAGVAFALNNESKTINEVEASAGATLIINLNEAHSSAMPGACNSYNTRMACDLNDAYCEMAGRIALAAHMAGRTIDYELSSTECVFSFAKFTRIRVND